MKTFKRHVLFHVLVLMPLLSQAETSTTQVITQVRYNASADLQFFVGAAGWGAPSCPSAYYAQVLPSVPGRDKLLAIALTAYATGKKVQFVGTCNNDPAYFDIMYIISSG